MSQRVRIGMIGGGQGAFIGAVHRIALRMDDAFDLVAGCFGRDPENTRVTGEQLGIDPARCYPTSALQRSSASAPEMVPNLLAKVPPNPQHCSC